MAIVMTLHPSTLPVKVGESYFWDAPQLPDNQDLYPCYVNEDGDEVPMQFICQINCAELWERLGGKGLASKLNAQSVLPKRGMLYFFGLIDYFLGYDVPYEFGTGWWGEGSVRAVYVADVEPEQLKRQNPFTEDDMIPPHLISFEQTKECSDGMRLLGEPFEEEVRMEMPKGWRLLLQLDSDENEHFSLMFHDMGLLYILIEEERLLQGDFSNLRAYMTSQ